MTKSRYSIYNDGATAKQSDPNKMLWMKGFPPAKEKTLSVTKGNYFSFPELRFSVNHMREFFPTKCVPSSVDSHYVIRKKIDKKIDYIKFIPWDSDTKISWLESLYKNFTDGIIILHKGKIVYEKYFGGLSQNGIHAAMSISKSFTGLIGALLVTKKILDDSKFIPYYIPELSRSCFADATVRQVMDMTTSILFSENYNDPNSEIWKFSKAGNPFRDKNYSGPQNYYEFLTTLKKNPTYNHGERFGYRTVNTEVLGWVISRVTGKSIADLLSELIWIPLGAHFDGYYNIDPSGIAFAGGGLNLNLRDLCFFGEMLRNKGKLNSKRIIPKKTIEMITENSNQKAFSYGNYPNLKGWGYSNMWWITNNEHKAFMARGVHGQALYIDPTAKMVIARFASNPLYSNKYIDPISIPAYEAIAKYLLEK